MSTAAFAPIVDKENIAPQSQTQVAGNQGQQFLNNNNSKRARRHRAGHRKQMAILKSQQMNENMELESLKTQQALQNAEIAIQGAELQQLQNAAETAQAYVDKLQDTQAVELDAIRQLQQEQDEEREEIAKLNQAQENQHSEIVNAERLLRMAQQKQSQELRRLRSESTEEREQMESLRQQQEVLEAKADELITAQGDERADIVLLKAQTDVHRERLVAHEVTLRELVMKQEACNELTEKELGDLQAESELDRAQIDRLFRRQQEEGGRLTDVQALLSVQEARLATDEQRMDALSEMTQQMRTRHIEDLTLLQQSQAVEHQERLQQEAALTAAQIDLSSNIRRLEKLREKEEPRIRLMERRQSLEEAEMSVLRERQEQHEKDLAAERERAQSEESALLTATRAEVVRLNREVLSLRNQVVDRNRDIDRVITDFENIRQEHMDNVSFLAVDRTKKLRELSDKQAVIDELMNKAEWLQMQYAADCALSKVMEREKDRVELANIRDRQNREFDSALQDARGLLVRGQGFDDEAQEAQDEEFVQALVEAAADDPRLADAIAGQLEEQIEQDFAQRQIMNALVEAVAEAEQELEEEELEQALAERMAVAMAEEIAEEIADGMVEDSMEDAAIISRYIQLTDQDGQAALVLHEVDETEFVDAETGEVIGTSVLDRTEIQPLASEGHIITTTEKRFTFVTEDEEGRRIINEVVEREEYEEFDEDEEEAQEGLIEEAITSPAPIVLDIVEVTPQPAEQDELERLVNLTESEILESAAFEEAPRRVAPSREFFPDVPRRRTDVYNADTTLLSLPAPVSAQTQFFQQPQSFAAGGRALPQTWMGLTARPQESFGNRAFGWNQGAQLSQNQGLSGYFTNASTSTTPSFFSSSWMNPLASGTTSLASADNLFGSPNFNNNTISYMGSTVPLTMPSHMGVQSARTMF